MNAEKVRLLVSACITYGHLGYLNLENQELICLYNECLIISQYLGDMLSVIQFFMLLDELEGKNCLEETSKYVKKVSKVSETAHEIMVATAFLLMAIRYRLLIKLIKAIEYCEKVNNISKKLGIKEIEGEAYRILGDIYNKLGKHHELKECSENCLKIGNETRDKELECVGYLHLGLAYIGLGKWHEAISSSKESITIALQMDNKELLGSAYSNIGLAYQKLGDLDQAQNYLESSLQIAKEIGDKEGESGCYKNLGLCNHTLGKYQESINFYKKGLSISLDIGDKHGEGILYTDLGGIYWAQGKYHKSLQCFEKGLEAFKEIGNRVGEGVIYMNIATVYKNVEKFQESLGYLEKSLAIAIETGHKKNQFECYANLGLIYQDLKKYEKAMEYHDKSLNCTLEIGHKMGEVSAYRNIGCVHLALCNPEEAIKYFEKSLDIAISVNDKETEGDAYRYLGHAYFRIRKYDEAITYLEKSLNIANDIGHKFIAGCASDTLGSLYYSLSFVFDKEGDEEKSQDAKDQSEEKLKEALQCWEWEFSHLKELNDFKISIVDRFIKTYKLLTKVLIERQKTEEALLISDRGRARSLGDILVSRYGITEERPPSQALLDSTDLERVLSRNQFSILFFAIALRDEDLHAWVLSHQKPIVLVTNDNQALAAVKALNEFYLKKEMETTRCENRSFESTDNSGLSNVKTKSRAKASLIESVERNVVPVKEPQTNVTEQKTDPLEVLFSLLVTPVMQNLQHEEIVIIPDGPLYMVPFAALRDPTTGKYLSETKSIRISPSLTTLKALQECTVDHHSKTSALIVGDPDVGEVVLRGEKTFLTRLPSAKREADVIAAILNAKSLTGPQATKEMVKKKLREGVAVIHIAAHGDSEHGHIALAPSPRTDATSIPEEQDYMLTMQEVQEIGVTAQLVVLSCCHSGRGDIKAEGVVGMSRAFLAAGARAVVASLWAIDDEATLSFMVSFYTFLKMGESASKSLQKAMDDIRGEEGYEDPKYWAPFFLIGDDVTISV